MSAMPVCYRAQERSCDVNWRNCAGPAAICSASSVLQLGGVAHQLTVAIALRGAGNRSQRNSAASVSSMRVRRTTGIAGAGSPSSTSMFCSGPSVHGDPHHCCRIMVSKSELAAATIVVSAECACICTRGEGRSCLANSWTQFGVVLQDYGSGNPGRIDKICQ